MVFFIKLNIIYFAGNKVDFFKVKTFLRAVGGLFR